MGGVCVWCDERKIHSEVGSVMPQKVSCPGNFRAATGTNDDGEGQNVGAMQKRNRRLRYGFMG